MKTATEVVLYCGRLCIALRGDHEQLDTLGNPGDFLALMKMLARSRWHLDFKYIPREYFGKPSVKRSTFSEKKTHAPLLNLWLRACNNIKLQTCVQGTQGLASPTFVVAGITKVRK